MAKAGGDRAGQENSYKRTALAWLEESTLPSGGNGKFVRGSSVDVDTVLVLEVGESHKIAIEEQIEELHDLPRSAARCLTSVAQVRLTMVKHMMNAEKHAQGCFLVASHSSHLVHPILAINSVSHKIWVDNDLVMINGDLRTTVRLMLLGRNLGIGGFMLHLLGFNIARRHFERVSLICARRPECADDSQNLRWTGSYIFTHHQDMGVGSTECQSRTLHLSDGMAADHD
jgi:hypothetical protein